MEGFLPFSLYELSRQRDVLHRHLDGFGVQIVWEMHMLAHHLRTHDSSDNYTYDEFRNESVRTTRRNKPTEWNEEHNDHANDDIHAAKKIVSKCIRRKISEENQKNP